MTSRRPGRAVAGDQKNGDAGFAAVSSVNSRATHVLRRHNIRVGLLGASLSQVPDNATMN
jgi:hypothetical protein